MSLLYYHDLYCWPQDNVGAKEEPADIDMSIDVRCIKGEFRLNWRGDEGSVTTVSRDLQKAWNELTQAVAALQAAAEEEIEEEDEYVHTEDITKEEIEIDKESQKRLDEIVSKPNVPKTQLFVEWWGTDNQVLYKYIK